MISLAKAPTARDVKAWAIGPSHTLLKNQALKARDVLCETTRYNHFAPPGLT